DGIRGDGKACDRDERRKQSCAVEDVDLRRQQVNKMGQRQPDRADLLPARREVVEDPPRDDEVCLGVVMAENETCAKEDDPGGAANDCRGDCEQAWKLRYNHVSAAQHNANRCSPSSNGSTGSRSHSAAPGSSSSRSSTLRSSRCRRLTTCSSS